MLKLNLSDIMCEHPITVKETVSVGEVAHLLFRYRINGILVVEKDDKSKLIGIFTTTDLLRLIDEALAKGIHREEALKNISKKLVGDLASKCVVALQKDTKVSKAVATMHKKNVHTIPVFDKDKLVGVVGRHDILNITFHYY
ncbi:MAG: CBS domain-containing protein [Candidatus Omnitrophica bacterium]|nr:CBS domain-containing protein [Candidatus Omnitrophota bacterium]